MTKRRMPAAKGITMSYPCLHMADKSGGFKNKADMQCYRCGYKFQVDADISNEDGGLYIFGNRLYIWGRCERCYTFNQQEAGVLVYE